MNSDLLQTLRWSIDQPRLTTAAYFGLINFVLVHFQVPLTSICYHGSRLVQSLAKFKERSLLLSSLRTQTPADLLKLASDPAGSHVLQALITTSSDKGRGKILKRLEVPLQGHYGNIKEQKAVTT